MDSHLEGEDDEQCLVGVTSVYSISNSMIRMFEMKPLAIYSRVYMKHTNSVTLRCRVSRQSLVLIATNTVRNTLSFLHK